MMRNLPPSLFCFVWWPHVACGILVPRQGIEPVPPAVEAQSRNHHSGYVEPWSTTVDHQEVH